MKRIVLTSRYKYLLILATLVLFGLTSRQFALADTTDSATYGSGPYGNCTYGTCPLTLTSTGTVSFNITPTQSGVCSIAGNSVSVLSDNGTGYTLQLSNSSTNGGLISGPNTIVASTGTAAAPASLSPNKWGYRVDGTYSFGAGPTTTQNNISSPISGFAGVPVSNVTPATIKTTSAAANPADVTTVWYGLCVDTTAVAASYTSQVVYTAIIN